MKQSVKTTDPVWGTFHATNCPAGCMTCSAAKDHSVAKFTRTLLPEAQLLPQADYRSHRILFCCRGIYMYASAGAAAIIFWIASASF